MSDYQVIEIGALDEWRDHFGGFRPATSRDGRRVVDHELTMQYIGMTANALEPGEEAGYWHAHARIEELYVFLEGRGQMGLDDDIVDVGPGSVVRIGQGVWRTWRCSPDSPGSCAGSASGQVAPGCRSSRTTRNATRAVPPTGSAQRARMRRACTLLRAHSAQRCTLDAVSATRRP